MGIGECVTFERREGAGVDDGKEWGGGKKGEDVSVK